MERMASNHRRHSSLDTLGWMYVNRAEEGLPAAALDRSISTRVASFRREVFPALKRQGSLRFHPGEYFAGCFGASDGQSSSRRAMLEDAGASTTPATGGGGRARKHSRSHSASSSSFLGAFNFGSMRFGGKSQEALAVRAAELNREAATRKDRVLQQPAGRWVVEDDDEYYLKPPAWKQALRRLRAEAKRHVHPAPPRQRPEYYDAESYEKNFDHGDNHPPRASLSSVAELHSQRVPIWERRVAARPLSNLELTISI